MQIFGKNLVQFSQNLGKMIWWHIEQKEKWESLNKLFSCVSSLVLTIISFTQRNLFCHQWILDRFCDWKSTSFQKKPPSSIFFCINSSVHKYASTGSKYLCGGMLCHSCSYGALFSFESSFHSRIWEVVRTARPPRRQDFARNSAFIRSFYSDLRTAKQPE